MANISLFTELMDNLFWDGYTEQLSIENPDKYEFELNAFFHTYN
ncbi:hypothetical protein [Mucilaginibacter sp.]